jgi:hypothetical protein
MTSDLSLSPYLDIPGSPNVYNLYFLMHRFERVKSEAESMQRIIPTKIHDYSGKAKYSIKFPRSMMEVYAVIKIILP